MFLNHPLSQAPELAASALQVLPALSGYSSCPPTSLPVAKATTHLPLTSVVSAVGKLNLS